MSFAGQITNRSCCRPSSTIDLAKVQQAIEWFEEARGQRPPHLRLRQRRQRLHRLALRLRHREGRQLRRESRFRIMALTDSLPTLTAYSNDVSYDCVFVEQLKNFAEPGDLLMAHQRLGQFAQRAAGHRVRQLDRAARRSR